MLAVTRTVAGGRLAGFEFLRIVERNGTLVYIAQPGGRAPTEFLLTTLTPSEAVFENRAHDFPHVIKYAFGADGTLTATVSDLAGVKAERFVFSRR